VPRCRCPARPVMGRGLTARRPELGVNVDAIRSDMNRARDLDRSGHPMKLEGALQCVRCRLRATGFHRRRDETRYRIALHGQESGGLQQRVELSLHLQ
jgi:hypothetical protein